jgi:hypothetical protein
MRKILIWTAVAVTLASVGVWAQQEPPAGGTNPPRRGERGERRMRGNADQEPGRGPQGREASPEQMRERMQQFMGARIKERLQASDDEWAVIEPLLRRVSELRRQTRVAGSVMGRGRRPPEAEAATNPAEKAAEALRTALDGEGTAAETIKARLDELRAARAAASAELKKAQEELRAVLTVRQEAELVLMGVLD